MMQGEMNFDDPIEEEVQDTGTLHCLKCGTELILKVNYLECMERHSQRICRECKNADRRELKKKYKKINSDPNKVWDPEYIKKCSTCHKEQNAQEYHTRKLSEKDGYRHECKTCTSKKGQTPKAKHLSMKYDAVKRNYQWTLEEQDTSGLFLSDCYYCGKPSREEVKIHGLDRVENDRGYHLDNVVPCCYDCNIAKATQTQQDFIDMCTRVAEKHSTYEKSNVECRKVYLKDSEVGEISKENFDYPVW